MSKCELTVRVDVTPSWWWYQESGQMGRGIEQLVLQPRAVKEVIATRKKLEVVLGGIPRDTTVLRLEEIRDELREVVEKTS